MSLPRKTVAPIVAPRAKPGRVQADRSELLAEPGVEGRGGDRVGVLPERVHVLARRGKEERPGPQPEEASPRGKVGLDVGLRGPRMAVLRRAVVGSREQVDVGQEIGRGRPVDAGLDLRRGGVGFERVVGLRGAPNVGKAADLQGVAGVDTGGEGEAGEGEGDRGPSRGRHRGSVLGRTIMAPRDRPFNSTSGGALGTRGRGLRPDDEREGPVPRGVGEWPLGPGAARSGGGGRVRAGEWR